MSSAIVAPTSATTSPASTTPNLGRTEEGDVDRENSVGAASSERRDNNAVSVDAESGGFDAIGRHCDTKSLIGSHDNQHQKEEEPMQKSPPKIRSEEAMEVGNDYDPKRLSLSSSLMEESNDSSTSRKGFGEGPLPRELRRIIMEVAKTGKCSWLSWSQETTTLANKRKVVEARASANSNFSKAVQKSATISSKSQSLTKAVSSSAPSSQYSPSFANAGAGGGIVRKQSSFAGGTAAARRSTGLSPRKRHRNGIVHKGGERMRFGNADGAFGRNNSSSNSRKRPLVFVRTNSTTASTNSSSNITNATVTSSSSKIYSNTPNSMGGLYSSAPSSVGSGRSTGSEPEYDSAQYECDSEGTSATTNSEISARKTTRAKRSGATNTQSAQFNGGLDTWTDTATVCDGEDENNSVDGSNAIPGSPYKTLQTAFRGALGLVLDHFYQNSSNGYKLSPAEKKRNERLAETLNRNSNNNGISTNDFDATIKSDKMSSLLSSEYVFQRRRQRLMAMLLPTISQGGQERNIEEPPFTIQRIAEVLVAPNRYYTQTHKLCNCLEKLLLVNSSTDSFGGSTGGDTSLRRREERELAALADEKGRQESKLRERRIANSKSPTLDEFVAYDNLEPLSISRSTPNNLLMLEQSSAQNPNWKARSNKDTMAMNVQSTTSQKRIMTASSDSPTLRDMVDLSRASLRTKFGHGGTEGQHSDPNTANENDAHGIGVNRQLTNSPPLPGINMAPDVATGPNISVARHEDTNGYSRQHLAEQQQNEDHELATRVTSPILFAPGNDPNLEAAAASNMNMLQFHHAVALAGVSLNRQPNPSPLNNLMTIDASTISQMRSQAYTSGTGPGSESTDGRSSASNSDIDSESDDISLDDSASDRSDGSDSGSSNAHHEPFTAARAMALNRMQQQQRLQSRFLTSLGTSHQGDGFRPPADSEYQSGDSIDSTRAEDSGGSDSSSSDLAD